MMAPKPNLSKHNQNDYIITISTFVGLRGCPFTNWKSNIITISYSSQHEEIAAQMRTFIQIESKEVAH